MKRREKADVSAVASRKGGLRIEVAVIEEVVLIVDAALHDGLDPGLTQDIRGLGVNVGKKTDYW